MYFVTHQHTPGYLTLGHHHPKVGKIHCLATALQFIVCFSLKHTLQNNACNDLDDSGWSELNKRVKLIDQTDHVMFQVTYTNPKTDPRTVGKTLNAVMMSGKGPFIITPLASTLPSTPPANMFFRKPLLASLTHLQLKDQMSVCASEVQFCSRGSTVLLPQAELSSLVGGEDLSYLALLTQLQSFQMTKQIVVPRYWLCQYQCLLQAYPYRTASESLSAWSKMATFQCSSHIALQLSLTFYATEVFKISRLLRAASTKPRMASRYPVMLSAACQAGHPARVSISTATTTFSTIL